MKNLKFRYSKMITFLTFVLFCICIIRCFFLDVSNAYDLSVYAVIITSSGALCLTSIVWYLKNSQAEKVARIQKRAKTEKQKEFETADNQMKAKIEI